MEINEIRPALEAILFAAGDSVETERIAKVLGAEPWDVRQAAEHGEIRHTQTRAYTIQD